MTRALWSDSELPEKVHIVGAGGSGMSGLAKLLFQRGHEVTASDMKPGRSLNALSDLGIDTWVGHQPDRIDGDSFVVASSAVPSVDPELTAARAKDAVVWSRPDLLNAMTAAFPAVGFSGTHGKTTSTALAVTALRSMEKDPTFLVGGEMIAYNTGAHLGDGDIFLLEADEAFGTFRRLYFEGLMVTNIEADHLDYYGNISSLEEAFSLVANRVEGPVVGCIDDQGVRRLAHRADLVTYGFSSDSLWKIESLEQGNGAVAFDLSWPGGSIAVTVPWPGSHVARNAAGVIALLSELGYDAETVAAGLSEFAGVRRRFEIRAKIEGVTIVEDYAHHPTEISATIAAGRLGGWKRVWAVFQPHRYTRTSELAPQFGIPLAGADRVIVTDVYGAGEVPQPGVSGRLVAEAVAAAGGEVSYIPALVDIPGTIKPELEDGDVVLLLGAGNVNSLASEIALLLSGTK